MAGTPERIPSLARLRRQYPTEAACRSLLEEFRWPRGPFCPHCGSYAALGSRRTKLQVGPQGMLRLSRSIHSDDEDAVALDQAAAVDLGPGNVSGRDVEQGHLVGGAVGEG